MCRLPYQHTKLTEAHQKVGASTIPPFPLTAYAVLILVAAGYTPLLGGFLLVTHPFAARHHEIQQAESKCLLPLDLHV